MCPLNDSGSVGAEDVARDESLAKVEIALLSVIFFSAAILNSAVLVVLWRQRKQMSRMRVFVFHLCLADLVVAFFQVCPQLMWDITDRFAGPDLLCRLVKYLQVLGMFSSTYMIVVMTVDRYQAVCNPMVKFQRSRTRLNIPVCVGWGISLLGSLPQVFIFSQVEVAPVRICQAIQINLYQKTQQRCHVGVPLPSRASSTAALVRLGHTCAKRNRHRNRTRNELRSRRCWMAKAKAVDGKLKACVSVTGAASVYLHVTRSLDLRDNIRRLGTALTQHNPALM
ncbi:hypothetical protein F2P81_012755 [Scophthalmus maximus]|uniref:G-protein coupled receptors family 1 profile domain-containing protein n=1 Tax=Scophthalmus maximus TaxID=52904 RepID=A0A6A4SP29_SCOMX|nr:hypothetical protein F2P81_012755 [Scophthalmus maximus]